MTARLSGAADATSVSYARARIAAWRQRGPHGGGDADGGEDPARYRAAAPSGRDSFRGGRRVVRPALRDAAHGAAMVSMVPSRAESEPRAVAFLTFPDNGTPIAR